MTTAVEPLDEVETGIPSPVYAHLLALSDTIGVFEHAEHAAPRREHGYCLDDVARALLVVLHEPVQTDSLRMLAEMYLRFVEAAITADGTAHNRRRAGGPWTDEPETGDWWGRGVWSLGVAAGIASTPLMRRRALRAFRRAAQQTSPHLHASAFAALGACAVLAAHPGDASALHLVRHLNGMVLRPADPTWIWPQSRMRYGNGSIAEAVLSAGAATGDVAAGDYGLLLVRFLLERETSGDHLSVTGTAGRGPDDRAPMFDQQPIEVAAIAEAAARAYELDGDPHWLETIRLAWAWFEGVNDAATAMVDHASGAGYDGLEPGGRNDNRGAESTLAALRTWQLARRFAGARSAA